MSWSADLPNPNVPDRLKNICGLHISAAISTRCRAGCQYCVLKNAHAWYAKSRWWKDSEAIEGFRKLADWFGPCFLLISGLEPLDDLPLVSGILKYHYAQACTNLMVDVDRLTDSVPPDRLELHPTFHPHLWKDIDEFLDKVRSVLLAGYRVPLIASIGHPLHLRHWDEWRPTIESLGIVANFVPMINSSFEGRKFPDGYDVEEREILRRHVASGFWDDSGIILPLDIESCAAGVAYLCIWPDGMVSRCGQLPDSMGGANLFRGDRIDLLPGPIPCCEPACRCTNLWPYHVEKDQ